MTSSIKEGGASAVWKGKVNMEDLKINTAFKMHCRRKRTRKSTDSRKCSLIKEHVNTTYHQRLQETAEHHKQVQVQETQTTNSDDKTRQDKKSFTQRRPLPILHHVSGRRRLVVAPLSSTSTPTSPVVTGSTSSFTYMTSWQRSSTSERTTRPQVLNRICLWNMQDVVLHYPNSKFSIRIYF